MLVNKLKAFAIHTAISLLILCALYALIYFVWFPNSLVNLGALAGLKIVILVDLILGPFLTFIVYNKNKKSLSFDLTVIALIQLAGLTYGMYTVLKERPIFAVLATDAIHLYTHSDALEWGLPAKYITYSGPEYHYMRANNDLEGSIKDEMAYEFIEERPYSSQTDFYTELSSISNELYQERISIIDEKLNPRRLKIKNNLIDSSYTGCDWLPVMSKHSEDAFGCLSKEKGLVTVKVPPSPY